MPETERDRAAGPKIEPLRLFFAAWPPDGVARTLHRWAGRCAAAGAGRVLPAANLHLTLAFLGAIEAGRAAAAVEASARVTGTPLAVTLDRIGYWPRGRIVFAGPLETPAPLASLAAKLAGELKDAGFVLERRAFSPHVTLLRNAAKPRELPAFAAIDWRIAEFVLARSRSSGTASEYEILARFAL